MSIQQIEFIIAVILITLIALYFTLGRFIDYLVILIIIIKRSIKQMSLSRITIPQDFTTKIPLVLIGLNLQLLWAGMQIGKCRRKIFNKEFMKKNFGETHQRQLKQQIALGGYPDMGNGLYSQKLSYSDWYNFNILQRVHQNYVENINFYSVAVISAGLVKANYGVYVGIGYFIGRLIYSTFYKRSKGAASRGRILGIALCYLSTLASMGIFAWHVLKGN